MADDNEQRSHRPNEKGKEDEVDLDWEIPENVDFTGLEEVEVRRDPSPLDSTFAIRLPQQVVDDIRRVAKERGLGATQLARLWLLDRLEVDRLAGVLEATSGTISPKTQSAIKSAILDESIAAVGKIAAREFRRHIAEMSLKDHGNHDNGAHEEAGSDALRHKKEA